MPDTFKENLSGRKVSPKGVISLPPAVRQLLRFEKGQGKRIGFAIEKDRVVLYPAAKDKGASKKASARGLVKLNLAAGKVLKGGGTSVGNGKYQVKLDEKAGTVLLYPQQ